MPNKIPVARFKEGERVTQKTKISFNKKTSHGPKKAIIKRVINGSDSRGAIRFEYEVNWNNSQRTDIVTQHRLQLLEK